MTPAATKHPAITAREELAALPVGTVIQNTPPARYDGPGSLFFVVDRGGFVDEHGGRAFDVDALLRWAPLHVLFTPPIPVATEGSGITHGPSKGPVMGSELLRQLEDAIDNIDYPGSDSTFWTTRAKELAQELAAEGQPAAASTDRFAREHLTPGDTGADIESEKPRQTRNTVTCLQCGQTKTRQQFKKDSSICGVPNDGIQVDYEWPRHRLTNWTDAELERIGINPGVWDFHRRTIWAELVTEVWANTADYLLALPHASAIEIQFDPELDPGKNHLLVATDRNTFQDEHWNEYSITDLLPYLPIPVAHVPKQTPSTGTA